MPEAESDECQNPVYPDDRFLTADEFNARARACSLMRARSPGERICEMDGFKLESAAEMPPGGANPTPHYQSHPTAEYLDWRFQHVIGPRDPWSPWENFDDWAQGVVAPPLPVGPTPPSDIWLPIARVNPRGISYMSGWSWDWTNDSVAVLIGPSRFDTGGFGLGAALRVTLVAACTLNHIVIGPCSTRPWVATAFYPLLFAGNDHVIANLAPNGTVMSDPFTIPLDVSNGLIISFFVTQPSVGGPSYMSTKYNEPDWYSAGIAGDHTTALDKSKWGMAGLANMSLTVLMIEAYYPPVTP